MTNITEIAESIQGTLTSGISATVGVVVAVVAAGLLISLVVYLVRRSRRGLSAS